MDLINEIEQMWSEDSKIDLTKINYESVRQYELHSKYFKILNRVKQKIRLLIAQKKKLYALKHDYYTNTIAPQQLKELNWQPNKRVVLKTDLDKWIDCDQDVIDINLEIGNLTDVKEFLEDIIEGINRRSFVINNINTRDRFENGIN